MGKLIIIHNTMNNNEAHHNIVNRRILRFITLNLKKKTIMWKLKETVIIFTSLHTKRLG